MKSLFMIRGLCFLVVVLIHFQEQDPNRVHPKDGMRQRVFAVKAKPLNGP